MSAFFFRWSRAGRDHQVITLQGALAPAEKALAQGTAGAAQVQEFHRQLFASSSDWLRAI